MYDDNNIFAKILRNEIPCEKVYENDVSLFFNDINPVAKIHVLGIPKKPCIDLLDFTSKNDPSFISSFFKSINFVVDILEIRKSGFRIISNIGTDGGQEVPHFHVHILAGEKIGLIR